MLDGLYGDKFSIFINDWLNAVMLFWIQYSSEEEEENLDDTMARLAKKKKVSVNMKFNLI